MMFKATRVYSLYVTVLETNSVKRNTLSIAPIPHHLQQDFTHTHSQCKQKVQYSRNKYKNCIITAAADIPGSVSQQIARIILSLSFHIEVRSPLKKTLYFLDPFHISPYKTNLCCR